MSAQREVAADFHCGISHGVFALGEDGQSHFAEAAALPP
jgi:hypothetical protein